MRFLVAALLFAIVTVALGDGKIFGATGELPSMPSQRAFLAWDEGIETLIVESDFKGDPGDYTWIIPVPAQPSKIEALEPGLLETFEQTMPIVVAKPNSSVVFLLACCWIATCALLAYRAKVPRGRWILELVLVSALVLGCSGILFPVFAQAGSGGGPRAVGRYDVQVLTTPVRSGILADVPSALRPTVDLYLREGWSVVTAKLRSTGSGVFAPHPLKITFQSSQPVYPMRLTGVSAQALHLDLFILGDLPALHPLLYRLAARAVTSNSTVGRKQLFGPIDHPDMKPYLREGLWLTRLSGILKPDQMQTDLTLSWQQTNDPGTVMAIDPANAWLDAATWFFGIASLATVIVGFLAYQWHPWKVVGLSIALGIAISVFMTAFQPQYKSSSASRTIWGKMTLLQEALDAAKSGKTAGEAEAKFRLKLRNSVIPERAVPGGFTVAREGNKVLITSYNQYATPTAFRFPETVAIPERGRPTSP